MNIRRKLITILLGSIFLFMNIQGLCDNSNEKSSGFESPQVKSPEEEKLPRPVLPWLTDLEQGKKEAGKKGNMLMVFATAEWSETSKKMEEETFSSQGVSNALKAFTLVRLDLTEGTEKNRQIAKSLNIIGIPTTLFLSSNGEEINRHAGVIDKSRFLEIINSIKKTRKR